jgi:hypothetical protein
MKIEVNEEAMKTEVNEEMMQCNYSWLYVCGYYLYEWVSVV